MQLIDKPLLDSITHLAQQSPRLRMNYNFHQDLNDKVQRLLNAMEPGTVLPVHRHPHTDEIYVILRGKLDVHAYNDQKEHIATYRLDPKEGKFGISMPAGSWHNVEVLEAGTVIFELKEGPYAPLEKDDIMEV